MELTSCFQHLNLHFRTNDLHIFRVITMEAINVMPRTDRSLGHQTDATVGQSYDDGHSLTIACKFQDIENLVLLF